MRKKLISLLLLVSLCTIFFTACTKEPPKEYTIKYMIDEETEFTTDKGTTIYKRPIPAKQGFHFINWYTKPDFSSTPIYFPFNILQDITAYAKFEEGIYEYDSINEEKECTITNLYYCPLDKDIEIPGVIDGYTVKNIKTSISENNYITSLKFLNDLNVINLQITLESIETIDLSKLHSIKNITISSCVKLKNLTLPNIKNIYGYFLIFNDSLTNIDLPDTLEVIYKNAFNGLINLKSIDIPANCKKINSEAFNGCLNLEKINIFSDNMIDLGDTKESISNNKNTIIYVKESLLNQYKEKYTNMSFAKLI